jgi:hypothetical protein
MYMFIMILKEKKKRQYLNIFITLNHGPPRLMSRSALFQNMVRPVQTYGPPCRTVRSVRNSFPAHSASLHKMAVRAKNRKILSGLHRSNYWWDFNQTFQEWISTIPRCAHHWHVPLCCTKLPQEQKNKNLVWPSHVKLLVGFQPNFTGVISTIPRCAHRRHVPLRCTKLLPEQKIKILSCLYRSNYWLDFNQTLQEWSVPFLVVHITGTFHFASQNGHATRAKNLVKKVKLLVEFLPNFTGVIGTIPSCAHHRHVPLRCTKIVARAKNRKSCRLSQVKLLLGFQLNLTIVISLIPCYAHCRHIPLRCTKWRQSLK